MTTPDAFRASIDHFLERTGMSQSQFGRRAVGDPGFVRQIRAGRSPTMRVAQRVIAFMNRPDLLGLSALPAGGSTVWPPATSSPPAAPRCDGTSGEDLSLSESTP